MKNPYSPPSVSETTNVPDEPAASRFLKWTSGITMVSGILVIAAFCITACMLIPQAIRLQAEGLQMPIQFRNSMDSAVKSSWILGITSIALALTSTFGVVFAHHKRLLAAWSILAFCIAVFAILGVVFKPI